MPSLPKTLLRPVPVPSILGSMAPQQWCSGLARGSLPLLVFDDDNPKVGGPTNCNLRLNQNKLLAPVPVKTYALTGVTLDASSVPLGGCTVKLYRTSDDAELFSTVSDVNGNFTFLLPTNGPTLYLVAYLPGSPDVAGTTINELIAA